MWDADVLWLKYAQVYDELLKFIPYQNLLLEVARRADIQPGMKVLDACCGTANLLWALDQLKIKADVTGLDFTPAMLAAAEPKVTSYAGTARVKEANLDQPVEQWGVTGPFDRIIFNNSLCLIAEPAEALRKAYALATEGAIVVASTPRPNPSVNEVLDEHLQYAAQTTGQSREEALQAIIPVLKPLIECNQALFERYGDSYHLPSRDQLVGWFETAGWKVMGVDITYAGQNWLVTAVKKTKA